MRSSSFHSYLPSCGSRSDHIQSIRIQLNSGASSPNALVLSSKLIGLPVKYRGPAHSPHPWSGFTSGASISIGVTILIFREGLCASAVPLARHTRMNAKRKSVVFRLIFILMEWASAVMLLGSSGRLSSRALILPIPGTPWYRIRKSTLCRSSTRPNSGRYFHLLPGQPVCLQISHDAPLGALRSHLKIFSPADGFPPSKEAAAQ